MEWSFEQVAGPYEGHTGGIVWDGKTVTFAAVLAMKLYNYDPETGETKAIRHFTNRVNGMAMSPHGTIFGCQEGSRRLIDMLPDGTAFAKQPWLDGQRINYPCDLSLDSHGRIWFTDPYHERTSHGPQVFPDLPHCSVIRLEHHYATHAEQLRRVTYDTIDPRCVAVSIDGKTLYVGDNGEKRAGVATLRAYPIDEAGEVGAYTLLHTFGRDAAGAQRGAEGICLDSQGNLVVAAGSAKGGPGALIYVFSPTGRVLETHAFPHGDPMRCAFGGPGLDDLYVTSSKGGLYRAKQTGRTGFVRTFDSH
jgi:sugar lactone lactonase YvrE